ncbi:MAG: T9SS type A sorting domain-containing protein [Bacteroidales bacterium]
MNTKNIFLYLCLALSSIAVNAADSLEVRIKLKSVNDILTFNQSFVPNNSMEYQWMVLIDSDNNPSTGNNTMSYGGNTGFDVALSVAHFKTGSTVQTGSIVSNNTQKNTLILNGNSATTANTIRAFIDETDTSLVMRAPKTFTELATITAGNRYFVYTNYYSSTGIITDVSAISTIPTIITDPLNDVTSSFIDIRGASINLGTSNISESNSNSFVFNVFPNPSSGIFKIESGNVKNVSLKVFNLLGEEVLQQQICNEIDLSDSPKGIYFVKIYNEAKSYTEKILIQ